MPSPPPAAPSDPLATQGLETLYAELKAGPDGLSSTEAATRLARYGPNALESGRESALLKFLRNFWGPIPWMIEVAAILSGVVGHWVDLAIIVILLVFNAVVGFWQEHQAANAVEALKKQLALRARVRRDGAWREIDATQLVPGDVVRVRLGDVIPADLKLLEGEYLSVDQSALTGESLPVDKKAGDAAYAGSIARQGEMSALVAATGGATFFGRTAKLVASAKSVSHFQKAVLAIGDYLIYISVGLAAILILTMILRGAPVLTLFQFALILVVAAIPVAMPAVLSVTLAIGAAGLARMKAIVTRLESIEEMAGMDILCSDKTGTLTRNQLSLGAPAPSPGVTEPEILLAAALASKAENRDAIDDAVFAAPGLAQLAAGYRQARFVPFDPIRKRTEADVTGPDGAAFQVAKGAPQVMIELCRPAPDAAARIQAAVEEFGQKGYRTLGIARCDGGAPWRFLGLLPLSDPPRADSAETIRQAAAHGIQVKMVTGDNVAIARQISGQLGLGTNIRLAGEFFPDAEGAALSDETAARIEAADGFAQVFPEHKYRIVKALQARGHIVGMTGDGVNDAPALKQADTGIAVSGATDAARAAAALVLTAPGLSTIVRAVEQARIIFERMNSYAIYRITETIRIMCFVALAMIVFKFYPITTVMIILLALLNDLPILTIAYDHTWLDPKPVRWNMRRVLTVATVLGLIGVLETFGILVIARLGFRLTDAQIQSFIYLKLAVAGHLTLFVARTRRPFLAPPHPAPILLAAILGTQAIAALIVGFGWLVTPLPWKYVGFVWAYCVAWVFIEDWLKCQVYRHLEFGGRRHRHFLDRMKTPLHPQPIPGPNDPAAPALSRP